MKFTMPARKPKHLSEEIARLHEQLATTNPSSEEYNTVIEQLSKLYKFQESSRNRVDPNTLISVGGSLLGVIIVVGYEHAHPIVSKAFPFAMRSVK